MAKERRCLKFTGYIFLPNKNADYNNLRYFASRIPGRIILFDEFGKKQLGKAKAFDSLGQMLNSIEKELRKRVYKRVKRK